MNNTAFVELIILILLIALSAFFSSAETALSTVSRVSLKTLADGGNRRAALVLSILDQYSKMLSAILICNNVVNLSASSLSTALIIGYFGPGFVSVGTDPRAADCHAGRTGYPRADVPPDSRHLPD